MRVVVLLVLLVGCRRVEPKPTDTDRLMARLLEYEAKWRNPVWPNELACVSDDDCTKIRDVDCRRVGVIAKKYSAAFEERSWQNCRGYEDRLKCVCIPPPRTAAVCWNAMCVLREEKEDARSVTAAR